jgi:putative aldouronate transport system substrate-binding protein
MSHCGERIFRISLACLATATLLSCVRVRLSTDYRDFRIGDNIELRYWAPGWTYVAGTAHAGEFPMYQKLEELSGVRVIFENPPFTVSASQQLELLQSSDDLPDIIEWNWLQHYPGGPGQAISDGMIVKLDELLQSHAPHVWRIVTESEEVARWITTTDGSFYAFPHLRLAPSLRVTSAPFFKKDWLEAVGMGVPETLEQWHDVLTAFRDHDFESFGYGEEYPFLMFTYRPLIDQTLVIPFLAESNIFANAFGISHGFYSTEGTYRYGPIQPEYREMLQMLADWHDQGLLHPNLTQPQRGSSFAELLSKSGAWIGNYWMAGFAASFRLVPAPLPRRDGTPPVGQMLDPVYNGSRAAAISAQSTRQVEATRWLDLAYSAAGNVIFNYGLEGETYTIDERRPVLTADIGDDIRRNSGRGTSWRNDLLRFARGTVGGPYVLSEDFGSQFFAAAGVDNRSGPAIVSDNAQTNPEAVLSFFTAERRSYEHLMEGISQYHLHNFVAFISGERPLGEFPDYVETIERMGIHKAGEILTQAWRRFHTKPVR